MFRFPLPPSLLLLLAAGSNLLAQDTFWQVPAGNWNSAANWTNGIPNGNTGTNTRDGIVNNGGIATIDANTTTPRDTKVGWAGGTGTVNHTAGNHSSAGWTFIGNGGGSDGTYNLSGSGNLNGSIHSNPRTYIGRDSGTGELNINTSGTFTGNRTHIGSGGTGTDGTLNLDAGTWSANSWVVLGETANTTGRVDMTGGSADFSAMSDVLSIGQRGDGTWTQSGGTTTINGGANRLLIGRWNGGDGTLNLSGGTITNNSGTVIGHDAGATGEMNISGGMLTSNGGEFQVGRSGNGTINQSGGTVETNGWVAAGRFDNSTGDIDMTGGIFRQTDATRGTLIGEQGTGTLTVGSGATYESLGTDPGFVIGHQPQSDGTVTVNSGGILRVGEITGAGAATSTANLVIGNNGNTDAVLNVDGGTVTANNEVWVGQGVTAAGETATPTLNITAGSLVAQGSILVGREGNRGEVNVSGGELRSLVGLELGHATPGSSGTLNQSGGLVEAPVLQVGGVAGGPGNFDHTGGTSIFESVQVGLINSPASNFDTTASINVDMGVRTGDVNVVGASPTFDVFGDTATAQGNLRVGGAGIVTTLGELNIGNGDPAGTMVQGNLNILGDAVIHGMVAAGDTTVAGGSVLSGDGELFADQLDVLGGVISPSELGNPLLGGGASIGDLRITPNDPSAAPNPFIDLGPGSTFLVDLDPNSVSDRIVTNAPNLALNIDGASLLPGVDRATGAAHPGSGTILSGDPYWIYVNEGAGADINTGMFANQYTSTYLTSVYPDATNFVDLGRPFAIFYNADFATGALTGGNDILLIGIPEPGRAVLLIVGLFAAVLHRRRG